MSDIFSSLISNKLSLNSKNVQSVIRLLAEGGTVPFIARYRKEQTGSLDELEIGNIQTELNRLKEINKRKESIIQSIDEQGKMNDDLLQQLRDCWSLTELEDLYLPYKQKRKTKASIAKEKGLEPLAGMLMKQLEKDVFQKAQAFVKSEVESVEEALEGARHIMAEWISERVNGRNVVRQLFSKYGQLESKVVKSKKDEADKYRDYFDYSGPLHRCPSHRLLAIRRGEDEGFLKSSVTIPEDQALDRLNGMFLKGYEEARTQVEMAVKDSYKRLISPSIETEFRNSAKQKADEEAIRVFTENLRQLLLAAPLGQKRILAIDPGFKSGCKVVCLDEQGNLLHNETIYPHPPQNQIKQASSKIAVLVSSYKIDAIAIGNGTAGRETEHFIKNKAKIEPVSQVYMVNESGASIYSASTTAREEFPEYDVTVRGTVSIGRRLMDPLAELVKIEPKSIGVGQYQHDVDQHLLKDSLNTVVESCVNHVGVNLNTASKHLLTYVSGLGPKLAGNITSYRSENGPFTSRKALLKVAGMGPKAFEQSAGFLRIRKSDNPLDNTAVHPERYALVEKIAKDLNQKVESLITDSSLIEQIELNRYTSDQIGLPTLKDIIEELKKPARDPRGKVKAFAFAPGVKSIDDLEAGMIVPGIVTNITNFGAFVDIGVKQDGLVHVSQLANRFVSDPNEVVRLQQHVQVKLLEIDVARKRIGLSMKAAE